jgi:hypothetical protein
MAKKALLIGINRYQVPGSDLRGCVNDVKNLAGALAKYYGFTDQDIVRLTDLAATKKAIQSGIKSLLKGAKAGDVLLFHYSGHGSNVPDKNGDEPDFRDEILCPADLDWYDPLTDDWLRQTFDGVPAGVNLTVIMDCCHSGSNTRQFLSPDAPKKARYLTCPLDLMAAESGRKLKGQTRATLHVTTTRQRKKQDVVEVDIPEMLITGCRDTQTSADAYIGNSYNGALTWNLVAAIKAAKGKLTYRELHGKTLQSLQDGDFDQIPQLEGRKERMDLPFLAPLVPVSPTVIKPPRPKKAPKVSKTVARGFVDKALLPSLARDAAAQPSAAINFDELKNQAMVVGSEVISFVQGVTAQRREDIVLSALFAQLVANKKVADKNDVFAWYNAYFEGLSNLGGVIQDSTFQSYEQQVDGLEAHEVILQVATVMLGASPTALAVVTSTIDAMKSMDEDSPWLTIFNRESQSAKVAKFQIALAEQDANGQFMVTLLAFGLEASSSITQVLFFKIRKNRVKLQKSAGQATINEAILGAVRDRLKARLADRTGAYIDSVDI